MCSEHSACIWTQAQCKLCRAASSQHRLQKYKMLIMHRVRRCSAMISSSVTVEQQLWQHGATFVKQCRPKFLCRWVMINHYGVTASFYTKTKCEDDVPHSVFCVFHTVGTGRLFSSATQCTEVRKKGKPSARCCSVLDFTLSVQFLLIAHLRLFTEVMWVAMLVRAACNSLHNV